MSRSSVVRREPASSAVRVAVARLLGRAGAASVWGTGQVVVAPLVGWDLAVVLYLLWVYVSVRKLGPSEMAEFTRRQNPGRAATDVILLAASVASIGGVLLVIANAGPGTPLGRE